MTTLILILAVASLRNNWKAPFYKHYHKVTVTFDARDKKFKHQFWCEQYVEYFYLFHSLVDISPSEDKAYIRPIGNSVTSNLKRHADLCDAAQAAKRGKSQPKINEKIGQKFNKGEFRFKLLSWVTRCHRPDKIIEDNELVDVCTYLNPDAIPPSRRTLRRDIDTAFKMTKVEVTKLLHQYSGRFNAIFDCWTAGNGHEFMALMVSFVHEEKLFVVTLDLVEMNAAHTGEYLARKAYEVFVEYGIEERILGQTGDNASNNDAMLDRLGEKFQSNFPNTSIAGRDTQVRCFGHILNLIYHVCLHSTFSFVYGINISL
jgi:hypothetical protein